MWTSRGSWATTCIRWTRWSSRSSFVREAIAREYVIFFEHDPAIAGRHHPRTPAGVSSWSPSPTESYVRNPFPSASSAAQACTTWPSSPTAKSARSRRRSAIRPGPYVLATLRGRRVAFLARHGARAPAAAVGAELPRQHLRLQGARRRVDPVGERRRQPARGLQAAGPRRAGSVLRPDARARQHVLWRRPGRRTSAFAHPFCGPLSRRHGRVRDARPAPRSIAAAPTSAWRGRSSRRSRSRTPIAPSGFDIIGMTNLQEAKLAREAEICYTTLALVTDYDCWHPEPRLGDRGDDHSQPDAEREDGAAGHRQRGRAAAHRARRANARARWRRPSSRGRTPCRPPRKARLAAHRRQIPRERTHADRRHRIDRVRLPDVVSRASSPNTSCRSTFRASA